MDWSHIANGASSFGENASATLVWPTHLDGDKAFIIASLGTSIAATINLPTGFDLERTFTHSGTSYIIAVYSREATSGSEANVDLVPSTTDPGDIIMGHIVVFRGGSFVQSGTPQDSTSTGQPSIPYTTMTPDVNNCLVLMALNWTNVGSGYRPLDAEATWTEGTTQETQAGQDNGVGLEFKIQTTLEATGTGTITADAGAPNGPNASIVIAFEAAADEAAAVYVAPTPQRNVRHSGRYMRMASGLIAPRPGILRAA